MMVIVIKKQNEQKCVIKRRLKFNDYKNCLLNDEMLLKSQQRLKSQADKVYTEKVSKIALSGNNDKRLQTFDIITTYGYKHWESM